MYTMKNKCYAALFSLIVLLGARSTVDAQTTFGLKVGGNLSYLKVEQNIRQGKIYPGPHVGVFSTIVLSEKVLFIPEIQFSTRRYNLNIFTEEILFGYLEVPLMFSWRVAHAASVEAGPYTAFKLYASTEDGHGYPEDAFTKSVDAGLATGIRVHVFKNFAIVPRYYLGLVPVADTQIRDQTGQLLSDLRVYNRTIQLSVAWTFNKK
jgi:hypothetical protein